MLDRPILFNNASEAGNTMGLGMMTGLTDWRVKTDRNMVPKFTGEQDIKNYLTPEIKTDRVIMADASDKRLNQLFKIDKITDKVDEKGKGTRSIEAHHIVGELVKNSITQDISLVNANPNQLWDALMDVLSATDINDDFNFHTDIVTTAHVNLKWKSVSTLQDVLFGTGSTGTNGTDTFIKLYDGEWYFDNYDIYFLKNAGEDNGLIINYGQNLKSLSQEESIQDTYTAVQGYATQKKQSEPNNPITDSTDYEGVGLVQYLGNGGLIVYSSPNGPETGEHIQNGQHVELVKQWVDDKNVEWLQLKNGNWIQGKHVTVDKKGGWINDDVVGQGHIKWNISSDGQGNIYETVNGILVANYLYGDIPIYERPTKNSKRNGSLNKNILRWKVFYKTKDDDNVTWYCLGTNQWVSNLYVEFDKQSAYTWTEARGVGTVNHDKRVNVHIPTYTKKGKRTKHGKTVKGQYEGVAIWSQPHYGKPSTVVKYVYHGQRYKIFKVASNDGKTWYNLGGNQWIDGQYMKFDTNNRDVKPKTAEELGNSEVPTPRYAGKVVVYDHPGWNQKPNTQYLYSGDAVNIIGQAKVEGGTWYHVTGKWKLNGWINGKYVDFGKDEDVDPYDPSEDIVIETKQEEVTLTLPEIYIKAPNADKFENIKVLKQDLTQYNVDTVEKLREVTNAYIYDNRIGEPETNLTVEYYQMRGKLAKLTMVDICYRATVHYEKLDINKTAEVTSCEWNGPKKRWESIHFGKRPETLRDTLDKFLSTADETSRTRIANERKRVDKSIDIAWDKFHDEAAKQLAGMRREFNEGYDRIDKNIKDAAKQSQTISQKAIDEAIKNYSSSAEKEVQSIKNDMAQYVKTHVADGKITYGTDEISATTRDGYSIAIGAGGLVTTDRSGNPTNILTSTGGFNTDLLNAKNITNVNLYTANIHSGVIDAGVRIKSPKIDGVDITGDSVVHSNGPNGESTVMSWSAGFSTTSGLNVGGNSQLQGVNVNRGLVVQGTAGSGSPLEVHVRPSGRAIAFIMPNGNTFYLDVYNNGILGFNGKRIG